MTDEDVTYEEAMELANANDQLRQDNQSLAVRCDELMAEINAFDEENNELRTERQQLTKYVEIMQRRLNNINHEMNAVREELGQ